jgi:uncharacterized peroxidase-related enzyme
MSDAEAADTLVHAVAHDWRSAPLTLADQALCTFAARLTHEPSAMTPAVLDTLRDHGFDDRGIHDAVQVIAYFNYITRVADALGVEPEGFIQPWGAPFEDPL